MACGGSSGEKNFLERLPERRKRLVSLHRQWNPSVVGYEEYGLQADIEHIQEMQRLDNYRFPIIPLGGKIKKTDRIIRLVPLFEQGRIFLPENLIKANWQGHMTNLTAAFIREEYLAFPVCAHDDMLDCLSRIVEEEVLKRARPHQPPLRKKYDALEEYKRNRRRKRLVV